MMDLRSIRKARGLTTLDIERQTGIKNSHLSMIENHKHGLSDAVAAKLAPVLGVKAGALQEAQTIAYFKNQAARLEGLDQAALKRAVAKDTGKAAKAVVALSNVINDKDIPLEFRQQASKSLDKLLDLLPEEAQKSKRQPDRDFYGRKREIKEVKRDAVGRAVK